MSRANSNTAAQLAPETTAAPAETAEQARPRPSKSKGSNSSVLAAPDLDRVIHERIRLGIVSALAANDHVTFNDLKRLLNTTDGNLSVHARKLEEAGYVSCLKSFEGRMPKTEYRLTDEGRAALTRYLEHMEALIKVARGGSSK
jgi:DNA-binding transcriptional ArsR family regulator